MRRWLGFGLVLAMAGCLSGCGQSTSYKDTFEDLAWWTGEEPAGDCSLPAAVDGPGIYFVSPGGDDGAVGSLAEPWQTLSHAASTLSAGDTVFVRTGTYAEILQPQTSGTDGAWITYAAFPGETATIEGSGMDLGPDTGLVAVVDQAYIRVCGLRVENAGPDDNACGILVDRSDHVVVGGCQTFATASSGIGVWNSEHVVVADNEVERACDDGEQECITIATTDTFAVRNNHVHDSGPGTIGGEGIDLKDGASRGLVYGNHVYNINRLGIYIEAWDKHTHDIYVYGNLVHDTSGDGFTLASERGGLLQNVRVFNNLAYDNACSGVGLTLNAKGGGRHPLKNLQIVNNTLVGNGSDACYGARWGGGILIDNPDVHQVVLRNNLVSGNLLFQIALEAKLPDGTVQIDHNLIDGGGADFGGATTGEDSVSGDPQLADPAAGDYRLTAGSPAVDAASPDLAPEVDYDGTPRPQGAAPDIGAFEF